MAEYWKRSATHAKYPWSRYPNSQISLDAAGLVALADLTTVAKRTALAGNGTWLDSLVISPGLHRQQSATSLNSGEYPAAGALTSGYVFRVENPATVVFLQKVGLTGTLTHVDVRRWDNKSKFWPRLLSTFFIFQTASLASALAYLSAVSASVVALVLIALAEEYWGLGVLSILILARLINTWVVRRRCEPGWHGEKEPGVNGDLLILLSQDRWVRMRGAVDDLKAVTSGQWLREQSFNESSFTATATVLVYLDAALASNVNNSGKMIILILLMVSAGLLAIANECTSALYMHGCKVQVKGARKAYKRRLELVQDLLQESDRNDENMRAAFAQMGMTVPEKSGSSAASVQNQGQVTI